MWTPIRSNVACNWESPRLPVQPRLKHGSRDGSSSMKQPIFLIVALVIVLAVEARAEKPRDHHSHSAPAGVFDHKTVEDAWKVAIETKKPLLVMFTSNNCTY